jgi:hypothetical protein
MSDIKEMGGTNGKRSDTYANAFILRERKLHTGALVLVIKTGPALRVFNKVVTFSSTHSTWPLLSAGTSAAVAPCLAHEPNPKAHGLCECGNYGTIF